MGKKIISEFYKHEQFNGKDIGCAALKIIAKGTLIMVEKPQVTAKGSPPEVNFFRTLMSSFNNLKKDDKEDYLKLKDRFGAQTDPYYPMNGLPTVPKELFLGMNAIETQDYSDQISKIFSIYQSNSFDDGVGIQRSRFNHSCCANVAYVWNQELQSIEYRALYEIKLGEELCINYMPRSIFMKNLQTRQHCLLLTWGFSCVCSICLDETKNDANEKYAKFEQLKLDAKALELQWHLSTGIGTFELIRQAINCCKEMCEITREKKLDSSYLVPILEDGFLAASRGYWQAKALRKLNLMEEFLKESENFAKLTALLKQALNGCLAEVWRQRSQDCQNWLNEVYNINGVTGC